MVSPRRMTAWDNVRAALEERIGERQLIWLGIRGTDAQSLFAFPQFKQAHSLTCPLEAVSLSNESCLELISNRRVDLDNYLLYRDRSRAAEAFVRGLFSAIREPCVVIPYRSTSTFTALRFVHRGIVEYLGLFDETQGQFEHKPWVESELRAMGVRTLPWSYYTDLDDRAIINALRTGPIVLRRTRSAGGSGLRLIRSVAELRKWPRPEPGDYVCSAPFLEPTIPLNVGACVFPKGEITLHGPSVQLIGIASCVDRSLGYCGNDFAAVRNIGQERLDELESMVRTIGEWLWHRGYVGAFGVDAVIYQDRVLLAEVNPRFQGSSALSARLDREAGRSDIFMDHIAAFMGLPATPRESLTRIAETQPRMAQCVLHNIRKSQLRIGFRSSTFNGHWPQVVCAPVPPVAVDPGGAVCRLVMQGPVTIDGFSLTDHAVRVVDSMRAAIGSKGG